jgi:hypothetical protein
MKSSDKNFEDAEFKAMREVYSALKDLDVASQTRVLDYVLRRLSLKVDERELGAVATRMPSPVPPAESAAPKTQNRDSNAGASDNEELEGISPVAQKWMRRNGFSSSQLSSLFSLGVDEIDLVAKSVPGKSKAARVRSVVLLQGIAGYLSTGTARITDQKLREACSHYDAYDRTNFNKHMKAVAAEVSGTREGGYSLTSRGVSAATELIKEMTSQK